MYYFPSKDYKKLSEILLHLSKNGLIFDNTEENIECPENYSSKHALKVLSDIYISLDANGK